MNPYFVLGVQRDADDQTIRRAYLDAIKRSPPDVDVARFQAASMAYEQIRDEASRHRHALFDRTPPGDSPLDVLLRYSRIHSQPRPLPLDAMKELLRACSKT
ncbi:hypothetical protein BH09GEM1_BH09GEM1_46090 [soil metagenome]